jgi:hypothetical protein
MAGYGAVYSRIAFYCRFAGEPFILVFLEPFILVFNGDNLNQEAYLGPNAKVRWRSPGRAEATVLPSM